MNGKRIATRVQDALPYNNDYRYEWDADLSDSIKTGRNSLALNCDCQSHFAGMFRRPFLYEPLPAASP